MLVVLTLDAKITLMVDQVGDVVPLIEVRAWPFTDDNASQTGTNQHFCSTFISGEKTFLTITVQLLGSHDVINLSQLSRDAAQARVLGNDGLRQSRYMVIKLKVG